MAPVAAPSSRSGNRFGLKSGKGKTNSGSSLFHFSRFTLHSDSSRAFPQFTSAWTSPAGPKSIQPSRAWRVGGRVASRTRSSPKPPGFPASAASAGETLAVRRSRPFEPPKPAAALNLAALQPCRYKPGQSAAWPRFFVGDFQMAIERTFSIIKPDATARNLTGAINAMIEQSSARCW